MSRHPEPLTSSWVSSYGDRSHVGVSRPAVSVTSSGESLGQLEIVKAVAGREDLTTEV